jgi:hypothetical protein
MTKIELFEKIELKKNLMKFLMIRNNYPKNEINANIKLTTLKP